MRRSSTHHGDPEGAYRRADTLSCGPRGDHQPRSLRFPTTVGVSARLRPAPLPPVLQLPEPQLPLRGVPVHPLLVPGHSLPLLVHSLLVSQQARLAPC